MSNHRSAFDNNLTAYEVWHGPDGLVLPSLAAMPDGLMRASAAGALGFTLLASPEAGMAQAHALPTQFNESPVQTISVGLGNPNTLDDVIKTSTGTPDIATTVTVQDGDSPYSIIQNLYPDATDLQLANAAKALAQYNDVPTTVRPDGSVVAIIRPGQQLKVPFDLTPKPEPISHTVASGDTLSQIVSAQLAASGSSMHLHDAIQAVALANNIEIVQTDAGGYAAIFPGQVINLDAVTYVGYASIKPASTEVIGTEPTLPQPTPTPSETASESTVVLPVPAPGAAVTQTPPGPPIYVPDASAVVATPETANQIAPPDVGPPVLAPEPAPAEAVTAPASATPASVETVPTPVSSEITSVPLITPPNLGPENSEGYYVMPTNDDIYGWASKSYPISTLSGTPKESRCASRDTIITAYSALSALHAQFPEVRWVLGDFNQGKDHVSHLNGANFDLYDEDGVATSIHGDPEKILATMKAFALTGNVHRFFFSSDELNAKFNQWAEEQNIDTQAQFEPGHGGHIHIRTNKDTEGSVKSGQCAPDTVYYQATAAPAAAAPATPESQQFEGVLALASDDFRQLMQNIPSYDYAVANYNSTNSDTEWGPRMNIDDIALLAYNAGWRGDDLVIAIALGAYAEGGAAPFVVNTAASSQPDYPEETSAVGLWQMLYREDWFKTERFRDREANLNPVINAKNAYILWERQGWKNGWEAIQNGDYKEHMPSAQIAADRVVSRLATAGLA